MSFIIYYVTKNLKFPYLLISEINKKIKQEIGEKKGREKTCRKGVKKFF